MLGPDGDALDALDLLIVRGLPRGSLEQVIFRMDALHVLAEQGVRCVNSPRAIERTVDKSWAGAALALAGVPTPPTIVCERYDDAMQAFEQLGGDVVVKPLFGAMGNGIVRVEDRDVAHRVFRALELERAVYYVQRTRRARRPPEPARARRRRRGGRRDGTGDRLVAGQHRARRASRGRSTLSEDERGLALRRGGRARGRRRRRRPAGRARTATAVVLEVNGIPGWQALQSVCEEDLTRAWSCVPARRSSRREPALVQGGGHECAGGPGRLERAQVLVVADAAAGVDRDVRAGRLRGRRPRRSGGPAPLPTRARSITSSSRTLERSRQGRGGGRFAAGELAGRARSAVRRAGRR